MRRARFSLYQRRRHGRWWLMYDPYDDGAGRVFYVAGMWSRKKAIKLMDKLNGWD